MFIFLPHMSYSNYDSLIETNGLFGRNCFTYTCLNDLDFIQRNLTSSVKHFLIKNDSEKPSHFF